MEKENSNNININESNKKKLDLESEKTKKNEKLKENIKNQPLNINNQEEKKIKLLKILFGENSKKKEEKKTNENVEIEDKIFYETSSDFHKGRLPKIKFRITREIEKIETNNNNEKEFKSEKININLNDNLDINKEKKKVKKVIKKKVKKKKHKNKKEENCEQNNTFNEKLDGDIESSIQDEKLSNSVQERKIDDKIFHLIQNEDNENKKEKEGKVKDKIKNEKENKKDGQKLNKIEKEKENENNKEKEKDSERDNKKEKNNDMDSNNDKEYKNEMRKEKEKKKEIEKNNENNVENNKEKDNEKEKKEEIKKDKENLIEKENNKELLIENENKLINEKEKEIKIAKKEIIRKLIKYSGKKLFDDKNILKNKTELNLSKSLTKKDNKDSSNFTKNIERKINECKNDSLLKREQIINAKLINNNSLSYKERIRRKKLEKDLEKEINNDDLSDDPYEETEIDLNNKDNEELKSHSTNKRKILKKKVKEENDKNKKMNNSLINRNKIYNLKSYKKFKPISNRIYTPKKAINSRENSKIKIIELNKDKKKKINSTNNNIFDRDFNPKENIKKTKFKIFNENVIKGKKIVYPSYNTNTLEFNHPSSIEISYIKNGNNINGLGKNNFKHKKILYIKKSPTRDRNDKIEINKNYYTNSNTINNYSINSGINISSFNKNKLKKIITKRIDTNNISLTERNISYQSNEFNSQILNDSNFDDINNTFRLNPTNILNIDKNKKLNSNANNSFTFRKHIKIPNPLQQNLTKINLEDVYLIENKFFNIIHNLGEKKEIANDCFDLFNYYYNCTIYQSLLKFFKDPNTIKLNINYTLMSLLISYDLSFNKNKLKKILLLLLEMFLINYRNLMLIIEYILNKINKNDTNKLWINKLSNKIIKYKESQEGEEIDSYNNFGLTIIEKIKYNTHYLMQKIHYILLNYDENNNNNNNLLFFLKTINANSYDKINIFFKENIFRENYEFCSLLASSLIKKNLNKINQPNAPYIPFPNKKKYSLVLDLDETIINLDKIKNENNGTLKIRPGTFSFLEKISDYFEIIIFSEAEKNYVDLIINSIEENGNYFDYILYREHTIIQNEEFIKDLSKLGRKLSRIIIVDNMPQNFRLQPENGIYIKPFWGEDNDDDVLFSLSKILSKIAYEGGDLRDGLKKYRNEIIIDISASYKED